MTHMNKTIDIFMECGIVLKMKYLILDAEMGGRDIRYSLLTVYFLVVDADFQKIGDLYLAVRPDDGDYIVSGQGMSVNRIDLIDTTIATHMNTNQCFDSQSDTVMSG